jgi:hypothetical protein
LRGSLPVSTHAAGVPHDVSPVRHVQVPAAHTVPPRQVFPHEPQLSGFVVTSTHAAPPHALLVDGHTQVPLMHESPPQSFPHPPQLRGSDETSTHRPPPHVTAPALHAHLPETHDSAEPHAFPHAPQLAGSVERSRHAPLQFTSPVAHVLPHAPSEHTCPVAHAVPHAPQFLGSDAVLVHAPPQRMGHAGPPPSTPTSDVPPLVSPPVAASLSEKAASELELQPAPNVRAMSVSQAKWDFMSDLHSHSAPGSRGSGIQPFGYRARCDFSAAPACSSDAFTRAC